MRGVLKNTLLKIGFTEKETQIFILLTKKGLLKSGEIAKELKINKGQLYRVLNNLQKKESIESTLERPKRYGAVPIKKLIDSYIESKREDVDNIEENKEDLIKEWQKIQNCKINPPAEKISIIEGEKRIFHKISQMITESKKEVLTIVSVNALITADRYGILEQIRNCVLKNNIKIRFLTQLTKENLKPFKILLGKIDLTQNFNGKDPDRTLPIFPRMVIKDKNELLIFISDEDDMNSTYKINKILHTNCSTIVKSYYNLFENLWSESINIDEKISNIENEKIPTIMQLIRNPQTAQKKYISSLNSAKKEIIIITSSKGLNFVSKKIDILKKWCKNGISIKIMAPITTENLKATNNLLSCCEVKHISSGYKETTIIDGKNLFQFNNNFSSKTRPFEKSTFKNLFFTNNKDYIKDIKKQIIQIWKKTHFPSETIRSITYNSCLESKSLLGHHLLEKETKFMKNMKFKLKDITEKTILKKITNEKKQNTKTESDDWSNTIRYFGSRAFVLMPQISKLSLPKMVIGLVYHDNHSSFGTENWMVINLWEKTKTGFTFVPVAFVQDNPNNLSLRKKIFKGFPVEKNIIIFKKDQLHIQIKGKTIFAAWTKEVPLGVNNICLPPSSIIFEGYGKVKPGMFMNTVPSGRKQEVYYNSFDAFVTFFHPETKYIGSGVEAFIEKEHVFISRP